MSADELESRVLLEKSWAKFKREQRLADLKMLDRIAFSQQKALDELRKESVELYEEAIQVRVVFWVFMWVGFYWFFFRLIRTCCRFLLKAR